MPCLIHWASWRGVLGRRSDAPDGVSADLLYRPVSTARGVRVSLIMLLFLEPLM
jgi:hypothetical protein